MIWISCNRLYWEPHRRVGDGPPNCLEHRLRRCVFFLLKIGYRKIYWLIITFPRKMAMGRVYPVLDRRTIPTTACNRFNGLCLGSKPLPELTGAAKSKWNGPFFAGMCGPLGNFLQLLWAQKQQLLGQGVPSYEVIYQRNRFRILVWTGRGPSF
jgi:hypothetical protein